MTLFIVCMVVFGIMAITDYIYEEAKTQMYYDEEGERIIIVEEL